MGVGYGGGGGAPCPVHREEQDRQMARPMGWKAGSPFGGLGWLPPAPAPKRPAPLRARQRPAPRGCCLAPRVASSLTRPTTTTLPDAPNSPQPPKPPRGPHLRRTQPCRRFTDGQSASQRQPRTPHPLMHQTLSAWEVRIVHSPTLVVGLIAQAVQTVARHRESKVTSGGILMALYGDQVTQRQH